jgi:hypothetical protein
MMKKTLLLAAFGVAGLVSAKDNGNVAKETGKKEKTEQKAAVQQCGVVITYWSGGQVVGQETVYSDQPNLASCQAWQNGVKVALQVAGFWLT